MLKDRNIVLGVSGGIAAYKSCELVRLLIKAGAVVDVVMTESATNFVGPLTFATLSGRPVHIKMFDGNERSDVEHISLADQAEALIVAPATANIIGKVANGIADDLLTTTIMATRAPVAFAPSMNVNMYENKIFRDNLRKLVDAGYQIMEPGSGFLACGWEGKGRLPEPVEILESVIGLFAPRDLVGVRVFVSAGPTREMIDPVRFISNRSSGKMGYAIAAEAVARGAEVELVSGPTDLDPPPGVKFTRVNSAQEMKQAADSIFDSVDIAIMTAAVADFAPASVAENKIKKGDLQEMKVDLTRNPDILAGFGERKKKQYLVGFAAETNDVLEHGRKKLEAKKLDLIVVNDVTRPGAGFDSETNIVHFLSRTGKTEEIPLTAKRQIARRLFDFISMEKI
jgi:phosphopantothenoylcysteine decarboxylase / phosphopantothenate---cysteine ligase